MKFLIFIMLITIVILIYTLFKNKSIFITLLSSLLIIILIFNPKLCIDASINGASMFFFKVFPSLFSFMVLSNILLSCGGVDIYSKLLGKILCKPLGLPEEASFVLIISALCGYPLGCKYSCELYSEKKIDYKTCEKLISVASNPSPIFVIGAVGTSMLQNVKAGYFLLIISYLSCIILSLILSKHEKNKHYAYNIKHNVLTSNNSNSNHAKNILKDSIENSLKSCISICGFITIFSVVNEIIKNTYLFNNFINILSNLLKIDKSIPESLLLGFIEMTNGCYLVSSSLLNMYSKILIISFLLCFSGLSIIFQSYSFFSKYNVSLKKYTLRKILQGTISCLLCIIAFNVPIFNKSISTISTPTKPLFLHNKNIIILELLIILLLLLPLILNILKKCYDTYKH